MAVEWSTVPVVARQAGDAIVTRRTVSPGVYTERLLDATTFALASDVSTSIGALSTAIDDVYVTLDLKQDLSEKGQPDGYAPLDSTGKIPSIFMPGFVDDFLEFADLTSFPVTGETGKMYLAIDTGKTYRWTGSTYGEISASPGSTDAVPEGASNLYFTQGRVRSTVLTGYVEAVVAAAVTASDTVLSAFGKLSKLITDLTSTVSALALVVAGKADSGHTHVAANVSDFNEAVDDRVAALVNSGFGIEAIYDDTGNVLTVGMLGPSKLFRALNDFTGAVGDNGFTSITSGTSAGNAIVVGFGPDDIGIVQGTTGTTATGRSAVCSSATAVMRLGIGETKYRTRVRIPILSTSTERFAIIYGLWDTQTAINQNDGAYFLYDEGGVSTGSTASPNFQCVTVSNNVRTFTTTSVPFNVTTYYGLRIEVNAAGTEVRFYIDETLVATHTTNIPTGAGREVGFGRLLVKSVGTTARNCQEDYAHVEQKFTTPRG